MYVYSLEGVSTTFATRFSDLDNLRLTFDFMVYPFVVVVVKIHKLILNQMASMEAELMDLQQDIVKPMHQSQSTVEVWKQVSSDKYPAMRQNGQRHLRILGQHIAVSPCTLP